MPIAQSRRRFLANFAFTGAAELAGVGAASLVDGGGKTLAAEPPPEITTIRLERDPFTCIAPQIVEELLHAEGFTDIRYVDVTLEHVRRAEDANRGVIADLIARGEVDFARDFAPSHLLTLNAGAPVTILAGLHIGCFEVIAKEDIRTIADLKGRTVGNAASDKPLLSIMASLIGLDPAKDIHWVQTTLRGASAVVHGRQGRCVHRCFACPPRSACQEHRARDRKLHRRSPVVTVTIVVCSGSERSSRTNIQSRPSACSEPFSRAPTFASRSRHGWHDCWSITDTRHVMTMHCRR